MSKQKVLFVCIHNSARSQMAEEILRRMAGDRFDVRSAGLEPGTLNPHVIAVLQEDGIDISGKPTRSVVDLVERGEEFDVVITVCDEASAERCPVFPGQGQRLHWGFPDPSRFTGSPEEVLAQVRGVRDQIKARISQWLAEEKR